mmetsp:Transcript_43803/g.42267  ORF Transcript_43803/g.42267 Transcript_43803/m.42267 type:complete len:106 (+) Transcript_43803:86-403(+)|eukprot:CAMPEP_0170558488 /NCGR_PEP_ID=MMETSP0211-20121228/35827_1 /TAXON_ID=311385 /ORGANISM="Pseudokeronopsis sp., Strain OXSARD2" /LENGTH=105 /DNA_ID=CAMNT_0010870489 /DNA_START=35 /DNA_END=352 /DNA_ORIENTATION=+
MQALRGKKDEYHDLKKNNEEERKQMKREERQAKSFKFNKMEKKMPFFPALSQKNEFNTMTSNNIIDGYMDSRQKYTLMFPDKTFEKVKKWDYIKHSPKYFQKVVG